MVDVYIDNIDESDEKRSHPQKDHGDDYVGNEMFDQEKQEKVFAEMAFRRSRTFSRTMNRKAMAMTAKTMKN